MAILKSNSQAIENAVTKIKAGGVVAFPTETVYGLGADALNVGAVAQIFEIKNRPSFDPLILHIADISDLQRFAEVNELTLRLAQQFWPGPLTLVLKKKPIVPDLVTSGLPTVAVRVPDHRVALELIRLSGKPIAAPSANPFGYLSPTTALHVEKQLGMKVDIILDGGDCSTGVESTILDVSSGQPVVLRAGGTPIEEIEKITGSLQMAQTGATPQAPGQLEHHYAPRKPLRILPRDQIFQHPDLTRAGVLFFETCEESEYRSAEDRPCCVETLSPGSDLKEAAVNLFSALHRLDESSAQIIFAEPVPEQGLGKAIMDRLSRAAATHS